MTRHRYIFIVIFILLLFVCSGQLSAQFYFGKNKVQYTHFDWQVMTTTHFKIYFYARESELAEVAAQSAEDSYKILASRFDHEIYSKIPLIIYSSPNYFVQTNVTRSFLPENVGGFTEFLKGRVVVPFNGSFYDFRRVIQHELVHVFMMSKIQRHGRESGRLATVYPPLWFTEGIAEYWSRDWDSEADLMVRDLVINSRLPSINELWTVYGTFIMYKLGQSICEFISDYYGHDKLTKLFDNWSVGKNFNTIVKFTLGDDLNELSKKWTYHLKKKYYPQISTLDLPDKQATRLTDKIFAIGPVPVTIENRDGKNEQWVIYKANKVGYSAIYMQPANNYRGKTITLLKGERSEKYESLHLMSSGMDQYDNRLLVFVSKSRERDVLYIYDIPTRKTVKRYEFSELVSVSSPRFSPDGNSVVFSGNHPNGYSDIFRLYLGDGTLVQLTHDLYNDKDPCFASDGRSVIFSSDRGSNGSDGYMSIYKYDLNSRQITRLTFGRFHDRYPSEDSSGSQIVFTSDRGQNQSLNIFLLNPQGEMFQITEFITGAFAPRFTEDGSEIYFYAYQNRGFHLFKTAVKARNPEPMAMSNPNETLNRWVPRKINESSREKTVIKYKNEYSLDIAQSTIAYDGVYGTIGGIQAAMSDVLGNNMFVFLVSNTAQSKDEFLSSFNVAVTYIRRTSRLNWGVGAFHLYDEYYNSFDGYYYERQIGGVGLASYPFSKFDRIETSAFIRYSNKETSARLFKRKAVPATHLVSFVSDNTLWDATGPLDGRRLNITLGYTVDLKSGRNFNRLASIDFRHYLRWKAFSCLASRFFAYTSSGLEPQRIYFGGSWSFRGYSRRHFYNRNILFNSLELRFPLINDLIIAFPPAILRFRGIRGAFFHDLGTAWDDNWNGWKGSFGFSLRMALGYLVVLRLDFSRTHDFHTISKKTRTDFFFGWNF